MRAQDWPADSSLSQLSGSVEAVVSMRGEIDWVVGDSGAVALRSARSEEASNRTARTEGGSFAETRPCFNKSTRAH